MVTPPHSKMIDQNTLVLVFLDTVIPVVSVAPGVPVVSVVSIVSIVSIVPVNVPRRLYRVQVVVQLPTGAVLSSGAILRRQQIPLAKNLKQGHLPFPHKTFRQFQMQRGQRHRHGLVVVFEQLGGFHTVLHVQRRFVSIARQPQHVSAASADDIHQFTFLHQHRGAGDSIPTPHHRQRRFLKTECRHGGKGGLAATGCLWVGVVVHFGQVHHDGM